MDVAAVRKMLLKACESAGSQRAWARANEVGEPYLSDVLRGIRDPGKPILAALGLRVVPRYVKGGP